MKLKKLHDQRKKFLAALERVHAMAVEMSGANEYAEVDYTVVTGGERVGVQPKVQADLDLVGEQIARMRARLEEDKKRKGKSR